MTSITTGQRRLLSDGQVGALIVVFGVLLAMGPYASTNALEGSSLHGFRILVALALPLGAFELYRSRRLLSAAERAFMIFALVFIIWGPLGVFWAPDKASAGAELIRSMFAILGALVLLSLIVVAPDREGALSRLWTTAFVIAGGFALLERYQGIYLGYRPSAVAFASQSTFGNPNDYAGFLLICLPYFLWKIHVRQRLPRLLVAIGLTASCLVLIDWTDSRTGAVVACVILAARVIGLMRSSVTWMLTVIAIVCVTLLQVLMSDGSMFGSLGSPLHEDFNLGHEYVRWNLMILGFQYFIGSAFMGHGAGSFEILAARDSGLYRLDGIENAHNVVVEILAQYGLVLAIPFALVIWRIARKTGGTRGRGSGDRVQRLIGLVAFLSAGIAASTTMESPWWWAALVSLAAQAPDAPPNPAAEPGGTVASVGTELHRTIR